MRILRISNILSLALATFFGVLLFWTSQSVQIKEDALSDIRGKLSHEDEAVRVLSVEWDYLNRPQRLEKLAAEQLGMQSPSGKEVVKNINDIPVPANDEGPDIFEDEGYVQPVVLKPAEPSGAKPAPIAQPVKKETLSTVPADKQNFYQLLDKLNGQGGVQ
ncbi:MAG: hypothetical protein DI551_03275 [Micavibrio aeruginosavorus]|uniref:Cell division protein FtsL n=1 Tax=Micavibrio aeruginosavorus TaxID=349221 RepID=A0A2W5N548_9BACT|nr:MAG: hypothetical protein DI551_03275 [Micavibrio aeruginosavorus]